MLFIACVSFILSLFAVTHSASNEVDALVIDIENGKIRGHILRSENGNDYYAFHQIPFASPPIGENRFKPPQKPQNWDGILDATGNTRICMQNIPKSKLMSIILDSLPIVSEDCLHLNVFTPVKSRSKNEALPVMVWIHGGSFQMDDSKIYGPTYFMDYEIVIVTINYRLGAFGFLTTEDDVIPGNLGLKDQHLALTWVAKNIEAFGGDPSKVTVAGESAGAASVSYQILAEKNKDLFRGAILESGSSIAAHEFQPSAKQYAFEVGRVLNGNFNTNNSTELLKILQGASALDIVTAASKVDSRKKITPKNLLTSVWVPVLEKRTPEALITTPMHEAYINGHFNFVPILIGFNSEEALTLMGTPSSVAKKARAADADVSLIVDSKLNIAEENKTTVGIQIREVYTSALFENDLGAFVKFLGDVSYTTPTIRQADCSSKYVPVYMYQFSHKNKISVSNFIRIEGVENGVGHAEELIYIWDIPVISLAGQITNADVLTRKRLLKMWTNFVKYLDPTPDDDSLLQNLKWPKVTTASLSYLNINTTLAVLENPRHYKEVKEIVDKYIQKPYIVY